MKTGDVKSNDYQEICIDTISLMPTDSDKFQLAGFNTLGITDKVYLATDDVYKLLYDFGRYNIDSLQLVAKNHLQKLY